MKAIVCTKYGSPEVLGIFNRPKPSISKNDILIKTHATSVTAGDTRVRAFRVPLAFKLFGKFLLGFKKPKYNILGMELSGTIEAIGEDVTKFKVGDEVCATMNGHRFGAYAQYCCLHENDMIISKPQNISLDEAAVLSLGGRTALYFLNKANIQKGQKVLIYGASGSVGTYAVQIAKYFGAEVTAVCSLRNIPLVKSIGADYAIDYISTDFTQQKKTYDVIFDTVGFTNFCKSVKRLNKGGYYLQAVAEPLINFKMIIKSTFSSIKCIGGTVTRDISEFYQLKKLTEENAIKPIIDTTFNFDQIVAAHRYVDSLRKRGNVVIKFN